MNVTKADAPNRCVLVPVLVPESLAEADAIERRSHHHFLGGHDVYDGATLVGSVVGQAVWPLAHRVPVSNGSVSKAADMPAGTCYIEIQLTPAAWKRHEAGALPHLEALTVRQRPPAVRKEATIEPYVRGHGKGLVDGDTVLAWKTTPQPDGSPHHGDVRSALGITRTTNDFDIYPDQTFALHASIPDKRKKVAKLIERHLGLKWDKEDVTKAVQYRTDIYDDTGDDDDLPPTEQAGALASHFNQVHQAIGPQGFRSHIASLHPRDVQQAAKLDGLHPHVRGALNAAIGDTRSANNLPAQDARVTEARDLAANPAFNAANHSNPGLQQSYPGPGRSYTKPTSQANPSDMVEAIDLRSPNMLGPLAQRYGGPALPRLHPDEAQRMAMHPGTHPTIRRALARRARLGKR
jgi:hypothetical protein